MDYLIILLIMVITLVLISQRSKNSLHMVQLEEYDSQNYKKWILNNKKKAYSFEKTSQPVKKPLVFTKRATRLYIANIIISGIILLIPSILYLSTNQVLYIIILVALAFIIYRQQPDLMYYSNVLIKPLEDNINMGYYRAAQEKIKNRKDLNVIGITGSFGKTSTKFILGTILQEKFKVLKLQNLTIHLWDYLK